MADAWTQAAELVMDDVLGERNDLAGEIREKGGHLEDLDIENLLNPASYGNVTGVEPNLMERRTFIKAALSAAALGGAVQLGKGPTDSTTLGR
ncbi:MAG: hypothetical protein JRJ19_15860, partial [Deltaproteobacteria bacterium]|nr:hypothetical protein [Deltaproteobacteria bacterium]